MNPPPISYSPPPLSNNDESHLNTLSILYYVNAGLSALGIPFLIIHFFIMYTVFTNEEIQQSPEAPPTAAIMSIFILIYIIIALFITAVAVTNFLAAKYLKTNKHKVFTMVIAGFNCMNFPLGTALGVFTFIVLSRPSVSTLYEQNKLHGSRAS